MSQLDIADTSVAASAEKASIYVPSLQRTAGQPEPIAAHGGLSYMAFDQDGDAGTTEALRDALAEIAEGESQRVIEMIDKAPRGPIKTKWGVAFREYDECVNYIRQSNSIKAPPGGVALPLPYTVYERPSYSVVPSNAIWRDPARAETAVILRQSEEGNRRRDLYFPMVLRDARRIGEYYPGLSPSSPELSTVATVSSGRWILGLIDMVTTASKSLGSMVWLSTVPTLIPLIRTSAPSSSPPTLWNAAVTV